MLKQPTGEKNLAKNAGKITIVTDNPTTLVVTDSAIQAW